MIGGFMVVLGTAFLIGLTVFAITAQIYYSLKYGEAIEQFIVVSILLVVIGLILSVLGV